MDHFALPTDSLAIAKNNGTLHRNFMGYTAQHTNLMIGLGVSAISDVWEGFAQNEKRVEHYLRRINAGELTVFKGHILTQEDLLVRKHILRLMCHGRTRWENPDDLALHYTIQPRITPLLEDGLVQSSIEGLSVTQLGMPFLRNVCMTLDARLWQKQPSTSIFSQAL